MQRPPEDRHAGVGQLLQEVGVALQVARQFAVGFGTGLQRRGEIERPAGFLSSMFAPPGRSVGIAGMYPMQLHGNDTAILPPGLGAVHGILDDAVVTVAPRRAVPSGKIQGENGWILAGYLLDRIGVLTAGNATKRALALHRSTRVDVVVVQVFFGKADVRTAVKTLLSPGVQPGVVIAVFLSEPIAKQRADMPLERRRSLDVLGGRVLVAEVVIDAPESHGAASDNHLLTLNSWSALLAGWLVQPICYADNAPLMDESSGCERIPVIGAFSGFRFPTEVQPAHKQAKVDHLALHRCFLLGSSKSSYPLTLLLVRDTSQTDPCNALPRSQSVFSSYCS